MRILRPATALPAIALAAALALAGCGHSDKASDAAAPDNVEMPAEEAMSGVDAGAVPVSDAGATATDAAGDADSDAEASAAVATSAVVAPVASPSAKAKQ